MGYRFRLHRRDLPGRPDIVLPRHRALIFVHGCFWHQHDRAVCRFKKEQPVTRAEYWTPKLARNIARDAFNQARLQELGWRVLIVWECETQSQDALRSRLAAFLSRSGN